MILVTNIPCLPRDISKDVLEQICRAEEALYNGPYKSRLDTMRHVLMVAYGRPVKTEIETRHGLKAGSLLISSTYVTAIVADGEDSTLNCFDIPKTIGQVTVVDEGSAISGAFLCGSRILRDNTITYVVAPGEHAKVFQHLRKKLEELHKFNELCELATEKQCHMTPRKERIAVTLEQRHREARGNLRQITCPEEAGILGLLAGKNLVRVFGTPEAQQQLQTQTG